MTDDRLPWFPCFPSKLLGALAQMKAPEGYVYCIVLLRIYEIGGACGDSIDALAVRTRLNRRVVSDALDRLFKAGKLRREGNGIINPFSESVLADQTASRKGAIASGQKGALVRWGKGKQNQSKTDSHPNATPLGLDSYLHLDLHKEERVSLEGKPSRESARPKRKRARVPLPEDWTLSPAGRSYATERGFHEKQIANIAAAFSNHHHAKGSDMADWEAAWRTWVENEIKFQRNRNGGSHEGYRRDQQQGSDLGFGAIAAGLKARRMG